MKENYLDINKLKFTQKQFEDFLNIAKQKKIMENQLKQIMDEMLLSGKEAQDIIKEK